MYGDGGGVGERVEKKQARGKRRAEEVQEKAGRVGEEARDLTASKHDIHFMSSPPVPPTPSAHSHTLRQIAYSLKESKQ